MKKLGTYFVLFVSLLFMPNAFAINLSCKYFGEAGQKISFRDLDATVGANSSPTVKFHRGRFDDTPATAKSFSCKKIDQDYCKSYSEVIGIQGNKFKVIFLNNFDPRLRSPIVLEVYSYNVWKENMGCDIQK